MKVLVCGGRNFGNLPIKEGGNGVDKEHPDYIQKHRERMFVYSILSAYSCLWSKDYNPDDNWLPDLEIISGGAKGVDTVAANWAIVHWTKLQEFKADWKQYGKGAGHIRNKQMLDEGKPDVVFAFPGGKGTQNMIEQAEKANIPVFKFKEMINNAD